MLTRDQAAGFARLSVDALAARGLTVVDRSGHPQPVAAAGIIAELLERVDLPEPPPPPPPPPAQE